MQNSDRYELILLTLHFDGLHSFAVNLHLAATNVVIDSRDQGVPVSAVILEWRLLLLYHSNQPPRGPAIYELVNILVIIQNSLTNGQMNSAGESGKNKR